MKPVSVSILAMIAAGCTTGPSAPQPGYSGTWQGRTTNGDGPVTVTTVTTQSDSVISGRGNYVTVSGNLPFTVTGASSRPDLRLTIVFNDNTELSFVGQYVTSDSVAGVIQSAPSVGGLTLSLKRQ